MMTARVTPSSSRLGYQPALDGIRGIAVIAVMGFNFGWPGFSGGFLGVDMFFALSGFLITSLLFEEGLNTGTIALRHFFWRRALRLYPGLVAVVGSVAVFSWAFQDYPKATANAMIAASALIWGSNWLGAADPVYASLPLGHTWSLGVEAQYYVLWGLVVCWVVGRGFHNRSRLLGVASVGAAAVCLWRFYLWFSGVDWEVLYLRTDTRLDAVLIGSAAAMVYRAQADPSFHRGLSPTFRSAALPAMAGLAIVVLGFALTRSDVAGAFPYTGGFALVALCTVCLILYALAFPTTNLSRCLKCGPLVWMGTISYSLYLWHVPVAGLLSVERLAAFGLSHIAAQSVRFGISLLLAGLSFYLIEERFRSLKSRSRKKRIAAPDVERSLSEPRGELAETP